MEFKFVKTDIDDLIIIYPFIYNDQRGYYKKYYEYSVFSQHGLPTLYPESSDIFSHKGVLRGLHYQENYSQGKLIHVIMGKIFDVALDLRKNSRTFGKWKAFELSGNENKMIYIPPGFAHGFMVLEDNTYFSYQCSNIYDPDSCGGILWNDPELNINWPIKDDKELIMTEKDRSWPNFSEYKLKFVQKDR